MHQKPTHFDMDNMIRQLLAISLPFANNKEKFQGAGGNTSVKDKNGMMVIKASGFRLDELNKEKGVSIVKYSPIRTLIQNCASFSKEKEKEIRKIVKKNTRYDLIDNRPSMETAFHVLLKKYVIHTHSTYANIINCSVEGIKLLSNIFEESDYRYIVIPYTTPGIELSITIKNALETYQEKVFELPHFIFLKNHGIIVHSDVEQEVLDMIEWLDKILISELQINTLFPYDSTLKKLHQNHYISDSYFINSRIGKSINFLYTDVLFPDQSIFINDLKLFDESLPDMPRKILIKNGKLHFKTNLRETKSIQENILSYLFLLDSFIKLGLTPDYLSVDSILTLHNLESEKYRKKLQKRF